MFYEINTCNAKKIPKPRTNKSLQRPLKIFGHFLFNINAHPVKLCKFMLQEKGDFKGQVKKTHAAIFQKTDCMVSHSLSYKVK
jgi:hypothetical protein